jgi:hypothetical protein
MIPAISQGVTIHRLVRDIEAPATGKIRKLTSNLASGKVGACPVVIEKVWSDCRECRFFGDRLPLHCLNPPTVAYRTADAKDRSNFLIRAVPTERHQPMARFWARGGMSLSRTCVENRLSTRCRSDPRRTTLRTGLKQFSMGVAVRLPAGAIYSVPLRKNGAHTPIGVKWLTKHE